MREAVELAAEVVGVSGVVVAGPAGMIEFSGMRLAPSGMCVEREIPMGTVRLGGALLVLVAIVEGAGAGEGD
jgi:hypothetical protein